MIKPKEKPIIFSGPSIPAIQNLKPDTWPPEPIDPGKPWKWQTRRTGGLEDVNNNHMTWELKGTGTLDYMVKEQYKGRFGAYFHAEQIGGKTLYVCPQVCPYPPGTRLWVRETWAEAGVFGYAYKATDGLPLGGDGCWRPSIHMPREAARLFLRVIDVRVERLQGISEADAKAEGCDANIIPDGMPSAVAWFHEVWERLHAKRGFGWETNPWVWVIQFEVIEDASD